MPLRVISCCTYRTAGARDSWTSRDWAALKFIKAIKGKPVNGFAHVPVGSDTFEYLNQFTAGQAPQWFGRIASSRISWARIGPVVLVPIPDSKCAEDCDRPPKTLQLADQLASRVPNAAVADVLRWSEPMTSAHTAGGTRDPQELYYRLRVAGGLPPVGSQVVLIDDILTSGGHIRAAAAFLGDRGYSVIGAVCAGRADNDPVGVSDAFQTRIETVADFENDPNWAPLTYDPDEEDFLF